MQREITTAEISNARKFGEFCPVYKVDDKTIAKTGDSVRLAEAEAMNYIRGNTSIPVPEVYNAYRDDASGHVRIVMEFIEGEKLEDVWPTFDSAQKQCIVGQLREYFTELRQVKGTFIGSVDGSACEDPTFDGNLGGYGPYQTEEEFSNGIIKALRQAQTGPFVDLICEMIHTLMKNHEIVLTHGDFAPRNILVKGTIVVGILDWELAGYYPEYWEYFKALRRPPWECQWMKDKAVDQILTPYFPELAVMWHTREVIW